MLCAGLGGGLQVEVLPNLDELALANLTYQNDRQFDLGAWRRPVCR